MGNGYMDDIIMLLQRQSRIYYMVNMHYIIRGRDVRLFGNGRRGAMGQLPPLGLYYSTILFVFFSENGATDGPVIAVESLFLYRLSFGSKILYN